MKFQPMSESDVSVAGLLQPGEYDVQVTDAEEGISKAGADMIKLTLTVYDYEGGTRKVWDHLVAGERPAWKVRAACAGFGLLDVYNTGELVASDFMGRSARARIVINEKPGYVPSNGVKTYIEIKGDRSAVRLFTPPAGKPVERNLDDDIPF